MDDIEKHWMLQRQEKYEKLYNPPKSAKEEGFHKQHKRQGGFFATKTRERLLGISRKAGRDRKNANFWYDVRETVKTALIDLQLFLETASDKDVHRVMTSEAMSGVVSALLSPRSDGERAKVAQMLAESGLNYLGRESKGLTRSQSQIIDDAIEASKQLTKLLLPEKERDSFLWLGVQRW